MLTEEELNALMYQAAAICASGQLWSLLELARSVSTAERPQRSDPVHFIDII